MDSFDIAVIGAGPGGYVAAIRAAQLGSKVALIEKSPRLGGTCLNIGCIPSKALLVSSELFHSLSHGLDDHGISAGAVSFELAPMMARKDRVVRELTDGVAALMKRNKVTVLTGTGTLLAPDRVAIQTDDGPLEIQAQAIILAPGSVPVELPFLPFDGARVIDSTGALSLDQVPGHLVVIGAGAVGLELGSVWHRLGARVTVVEMLRQITPFADRQLASQLERALKKQGLDIRLKTTVSSAVVSDNGVELTLESAKGKVETLTGDRVLVAVGRRPFTTGLGLEELGITLDKMGRIPVDDTLQTRVSGIYAIGDVVAGPMLAHKAEEEGIAAAESIAGHPISVEHGRIPSVVYTDPELATVGLTEAQAKEQGIKVSSGKFLFRANGRAKAMGAEDGMVKVLADADSGTLLGVQIVGPCASELIAEAALALERNTTADELARTVHAHPTLSEAVMEAAMAVNKRSIHS